MRIFKIPLGVVVELSWCSACIEFTNRWPKTGRQTRGSDIQRSFSATEPTESQPRKEEIKTEEGREKKARGRGGDGEERERKGKSDGR